MYKLHVETVVVGDGVTLPGLRTRVTTGAPNVLGGAANNTFTPGRVGVTIAGGDNHTTGVTGDHGTIGGGFQNVAAQQATVSGGAQNTANAFRTTVGGGSANVANATGATVGGGVGNRAQAEYGTIAGGGWSAFGDVTTSNHVFDNFGTVGGGANNRAGSDDGNLANATHATIAGGQGNTASGPHATIAGGRANRAEGQHSAIAGGIDNLASGWAGFVGGGQRNDAGGQASVIVGGQDNRTSQGTYNFVGGGTHNHVRGFLSAIVGGGFNDPNQPFNTANRTYDNFCFIGGGANNQAGSNDGNVINAWYATVGGGESNAASGSHATVPGGSGNVAAGQYSFAAGQNARALDDNSFVWSGSDGVASSFLTGQFLVDAPSGMWVFRPDVPDQDFVFLPSAALVINQMQPTLEPFGVQRGIGTWSSAAPAGSTALMVVGPQMGVQGHAPTGTGVWGFTQRPASSGYEPDPDEVFPVGVVGQNSAGGGETDPHRKRGTGVLGLHGSSGFGTTPFGTRGADFAGVAGLTTMTPDSSHPTGPVRPAGVYGRALTAGDWYRPAVGVEGVVGDDIGIIPLWNTGVFGQSALGNGVAGLSSGLQTNPLYARHAGVVGAALSGGNGVGVLGEAYNSIAIAGHFRNFASGVAGRFEGNVEVTGNHTVSGTKSFRIDHPLDPENKYLQHACIESDAPLNFYSGNVVTDVAGYATIELPAWFEAINTDLRYQLTVIDEGDDFIQAKITNKVKKNRFTLRTSKGGVEVSWQVTGTRHDAYCRANPMAVELEKKPDDRGRYLYPQGFGQPVEAAIGWYPSSVVELPQAPQAPARKESELQVIEVPPVSLRGRSEP